jgi:hypothetical protein
MSKETTSGPAITIMDAVNDPAIFGPWFLNKESFAAWFCFLKVMFAQPLDEAELAIFQKCTGRTAPSLLGYLEATLAIGRRGGKSLIMALIAAFLACFFDWRPFLTGGERAVIVIVAADRRQAAVIFRYLKGMLEIPLLAGLIDRETLDTIELRNLVSIEIQTASWKTIRGRTVVAALCDELAFWSDETSSNPDVEIINALKPAMATIPRAVMIKASSPYARRGALWNDYRKHFGKDESTVLVWQADTRTMNPSVPETFIAAAYEDDPAAASAEYGGLFRTDVENLVSRDVVEACIVPGRHELPPIAGVRYSAFLDAAGGSGADSMTLAIGHREGDRAVLDLIRERVPHFSPEEVVSEFSQVLSAYRVKTVVSDRWGGAWPAERFQVHGIACSTSAKAKSDIYRDFLPQINGGRVELLDHPKLINQLCSLERRTARGGRDSIDHPPGNHHDDLINSAAGVLTGEIIQDWSGSRAFLELARRDMALVPTIGGHPKEKPTPVERTWAPGSVEWCLQQQGLGGPPPPAPSQSDPGQQNGHNAGGRDQDAENLGLIHSTLRG